MKSPDIINLWFCETNEYIKTMKPALRFAIFLCFVRLRINGWNPPEMLLQLSRACTCPGEPEPQAASKASPDYNLEVIFHHQIGDSLGFIIKLVNPWHQFRSSPCRVSKCHTESLLYCLVISDSVASGATWWCSSNLSWRSKMCCPNPESALQHQHQDDLLRSANFFQRPSIITSSSKLPPRLKDLIGRSLTLFWVIGSRQNTLDDPQCHAAILNGLPQKVELWENVRKCEKAQPKKAMAPGYSWPCSNSPAMKTIFHAATALIRGTLVAFDPQMSHGIKHWNRPHDACLQGETRIRLWVELGPRFSFLWNSPIPQTLHSWCEVVSNLSTLRLSSELFHLGSLDVGDFAHKTAKECIHASATSATSPPLSHGHLATRPPIVQVLGLQPSSMAADPRGIQGPIPLGSVVASGV